MIKKTLVMGASLKPNRYSNFAIKKLLNSNIEVVAFGLREGEVNGVFISKDLVAHNNIHTVTLYLNSVNQRFYYDYILSLKPERVIFNPGTENPEFYKILNKNHINYEEACTLVLLSTNQF